MAKAGFAIIGLGVRAELHAQVIERCPDAALVAVCSRTLDKAKEFSSRHGFCKVYDEVEYLLEDGDVDIVVITTPSGLHFHPASLAIKNGQHVIVECPLELSEEKALLIHDLSEEEGVYLECIYPDRFSYSTELIRDAISNGELGKIISFDYKIKDTNTDVYLQASPWRLDPHLSGGRIFLPSNIQAIDKLLFVLGEDLTLVNDKEPFELKTPSGVQGTISIKKDNSDILSITGEKGCIKICGNSIEEWNISDMEKPALDVCESALLLLERQYEKFLNAVTKGYPVCVDPVMASLSISLCEKISKNIQIR